MTQHTHKPHSRRPADIWAAARADYESGASIRIVAERHGLHVRTVSRHARTEGWVAPGVGVNESLSVFRVQKEYGPEALSRLAAVGHVVDSDEEALLLRPDTVGLCRFAFRRAAESAGLSGPTEALAWIRLAEATARLRRSVDVDIRPMGEADYRRIAALSRLSADPDYDIEAAAGLDKLDPQKSKVSESVP